MNNLVSIIIPVYNTEKYLAECIDSLVTQTYKNLEIILVNDGSTDRSASICKSMSEAHSNIILINQENRGVSSARNTGMEHARGDYIVFLDSDDKMPSNAVQVLLDAVIDADADMAIGKISEKEKIPIGCFTDEEFLILALQDHSVTYSACRTLYKRSFIQNIRFPEGVKTAEDSYFVFLCAMKKPRVVTVNDVVYSYTVNYNSSSRSLFNEYKYNDICQLLEQKEAWIRKDYAHLLPVFYHLKVKIQMMLLTNLMQSWNESFRRMEKETLQRFHACKEHFIPELPYSNKHLYNILNRNLYYPYKAYFRAKRFVKRLVDVLRGSF